MAILNFNYQQAINQANQVDAVANDMLAIANRQMQTTVDSIGACWGGDSATQFLKHCVSTQTDIRTQAKQLQSLARRIREVARVIREAEERAKELQRQRNIAAAAEAAKGGGGFQLG